MNRLLACSHNGFFSCGTQKKLSASSSCRLCCLSLSTRKMQWLCSAYPLPLIEPLFHLWNSVSKGWRMALPLFIFLKAPLQAGGYKAELGPLHPPQEAHVPCGSAAPMQDQGASAWSCHPALWHQRARDWTCSPQCGRCWLWFKAGGKCMLFLPCFPGLNSQQGCYSKTCSDRTLTQPRWCVIYSAWVCCCLFFSSWIW